VRALDKRVRSSLGWHDSAHGSDEVPIIPVQLGTNGRALQAAERAERAGMLIPAIRPPTVPEGTSRLRVSLSAAHSDEEIDALIEFLALESSL
jgi:8-amino-7-oxononanoate synthase